MASGFDAAAGDELGGCFVSPPCYAHMTHMLMSLAGGKIAVCLEVASPPWPLLSSHWQWHRAATTLLPFPSPPLPWLEPWWGSHRIELFQLLLPILRLIQSLGWELFSPNIGEAYFPKVSLKGTISEVHRQLIVLHYRTKQRNLWWRKITWYVCSAGHPTLKIMI